MWRSRLGVTVELRNVEWKVYLERTRRGEYDIARRGYVGEYLDPHALLSLFAGTNVSNTTGWKSAEFDRLLEQSDRESDPAKRRATLAKAERLLIDEAPLIPLHHYVAHNWIKPFVKGVHHNARDMHPLQGVTLEGDGAPADGVLIFNAGEEPHSLDPALSDDIGGLKVLMHLFEGLAAYDPRDAAPVPAAAERWEVSADGLTWTFALRPAKWSNGDAVTARDFEHAWKRVIDPALGSAYAFRVYDLLKNGKAYYLGASADLALREPAKLTPEVAAGLAAKVQKRHAAPLAKALEAAKDDGVRAALRRAIEEAPKREDVAIDAVGVRAAGDATLVVELDHPTPYLPHLLCLNLFYPVHRATVEKHGDRWIRPENLVSNGPYCLTEARPNDRKVFERSATYRDAAGVRLAKFVFLYPGPDAHLGLRMYRAGQVHWLFNAPTEFMDELVKMPDHVAGPYNATYFYVFNTAKKPLDDPRVRRALSLVIDRKAITEKILRGGETPAERLTPPLYPGYEVK
jgi:oligopeptide transport system substrate-binding protein